MNSKKFASYYCFITVDNLNKKTIYLYGPENYLSKKCFFQTLKEANKINKKYNMFHFPIANKCAMRLLNEYEIVVLNIDGSFSKQIDISISEKLIEHQIRILENEY